MGIFSKETPKNVDRIPEAPRKTGDVAPVAASTTIIARGTQVDGIVKGKLDLRIEGEVSGEIRNSAQVVVGPSGRVKCLIRARSVKVAGRVEGDLTADERIELAPSAVVIGNLLAPKILIKEGANLQGSVDMSAPPADRGPSPTKEKGAPQKQPENTDDSREKSAKNSASQSDSSKAARKKH